MKRIAPIVAVALIVCIMSGCGGDNPAFKTDATNYRSNPCTYSCRQRNASGTRGGKTICRIQREN